ncbi:MAG TPA: hypothetical protein VNJ54_08940 [Plantibacter sp.]|uniref:hypothetical protein n=1 Tax=unclassified Plantibacter TaxID=2624265 RepID=UPI002CF42C36|nr:hypothetical protein [Plantibacter sp.]
MEQSASARSRRGRPTARLTLSCALAFLALLSGCAAPTGLSPTTTADDPSAVGLDIELRQNRDQYATHLAIIRVSNTSGDDVVVERVELSGSAFETRTTRERTSAIPAGQTKDLAVDIPRADCDATAHELRAEAEVELDDGRTVHADDLPDPTHALPRIHAADCTAAGVAGIATVSAAPEVRLEGAGARTVAVLTITATPTGAPGRLELVSLRSTVLLQPAPPSDGSAAPEEWPLGIVVDASTGTRTIDVRIVPSRCDPHALAEDKVGTLFPLVVRVDDDEEALLTLPLPPGTADALKAAVRLACA